MQRYTYFELIGNEMSDKASDLMAIGIESTSHLIFSNILSTL